VHPKGNWREIPLSLCQAIKGRPKGGSTALLGDPLEWGKRMGLSWERQLSTGDPIEPARLW